MTDQMAPPGQAPAPAPPRTGQMLRYAFAAQILLALVLISSDVARVLPTLAWPSLAPGIDAPIGPGDQTRRYAPARLPLRAPTPGTRPVPDTTDMPSRLAFADTTWEAEPVITLTGSIAPGDAARFAEFLAGIDPAPVAAYLNSPGGSVRDALDIGRALRKAGIATRMAATDICLSACPYLLAAGTTRTVDPAALVGVHQHYFGENVALPAFLAIEDIQLAQGEVMRYLDDMGVDPMLMEPALTTPPSEIYLLTPDELARYALITPPPS